MQQLLLCFTTVFHLQGNQIFQRLVTTTRPSRGNLNQFLTVVKCYQAAFFHTLSLSFIIIQTYPEHCRSGGAWPWCCLCACRRSCPCRRGSSAWKTCQNGPSPRRTCTSGETCATTTRSEFFTFSEGWKLFSNNNNDCAIRRSKITGLAFTGQDSHPFA